MEFSKVSSDAMPALTGRRCVGTVTEWPEFPANKVVPQNCFFCPCSLRGTRIFCLEKEYCYDEEITGKAMAGLTSLSTIRQTTLYY